MHHKPTAAVAARACASVKWRATGCGLHMLHSGACMRSYTRHSTQTWSGTNFCVNSYLSGRLLWSEVHVCGTMQETYYRKCNDES